jgi:mRNA-degrading endonuclease HigB of HigAB toxin-antitoxin module
MSAKKKEEEARGAHRYLFPSPLEGTKKTLRLDAVGDRVKVLKYRCLFEIKGNHNMLIGTIHYEWRRALFRYL